jgi:diguanylate cyclase (GGDEF)-like protein
VNPHTPIKTADDSRATLSQLVDATTELSAAEDMAEVRTVVAAAARNLTGADGAAYVVRDGKQCFYAEEDAIEPLWKGRYFPIDECISGWVMVYRQAVAVSDIDLDERLHTETYGATFVKSMAMVPIRSTSPVGAIGTYWDRIHTPSKAEISALQSLAEATAVTLENVSLNSFALNDSLSCLYNRRGFFSRGSERISSNRDLGVGTSVLFAALNGIQQINDQFGYEAGDEAIRRAGAALQSACGRDAVIGRIAGDVFGVCGTFETLPSTDASELERIIDEATPESGWPVGLTVGVALGHPGEQYDLDSLVAESNRTMYERRHGRTPPLGEQIARTAPRA